MKSTIKRVAFVVLTTALGAGALATADAQTSPAPAASSAPQAMHRGHFHHHGSPIVGSLLRATRQLNLNAQQQAYIKGILAESRPTHQPGAQPQGPSMTVLGNPGDSNYAAAVQNAQQSAAARITKETTIANEIYGILSTQQKAQLPTVLASLQAQDQARRAQWAAKRAAATGNG